MRLFEEYRYFFYITNDRDLSAEEVVFSANDRCDQENLIAQLKSGVYALTTPVDNLVSNWAYMVMASLAWSLKVWRRAAGARNTAARSETQGRETHLIADGVSRRTARHSSRCRVRSCEGGRRLVLPDAVVEPVARGIPPLGRASARELAVPEGSATEVGVRTPRSLLAIEQREGGEMLMQMNDVCWERATLPGVASLRNQSINDSLP